MIHFPEPYNIFTGALRMSGVTNAFEIARLTPTPVWGCTANVCMRNEPWLHFQEDWGNPVEARTSTSSCASARWAACAAPTRRP